MSEILNEEIQLNEYMGFDGVNSQVIAEETNGVKTYRIRGCFSKAGCKNKNGRVYPKPIMKKAVEEVQEAIQQGKFIAEIEHPSSAKINLERIAAKVNSLEMLEDGSVVGEMKVLDTDAGRVVKNLIDEGVYLGVSTRGTGSVKKTRIDLGEGVVEDVLEVQPDFKLFAIDIVANPSAGEFGSPSFISESVERKQSATTLRDVWHNMFN